MKQILSPNAFLDDFILNYELAERARISTNAYKFWPRVISAGYEGSRAVFLHKASILPKYSHLISGCSDLSGLVLSSAFCYLTGLAPSHLTKNSCSQLQKKLHIKTIGRYKFVDLRRLYDDLGLDYGAQIYIEKCKYFSPEPLEKRIKLTPTLCLGYY